MPGVTSLALLVILDHIGGSSSESEFFEGDGTTTSIKGVAKAVVVSGMSIRFVAPTRAWGI